MKGKEVQVAQNQNRHNKPVRPEENNHSLIPGANDDDENAAMPST